ncbi:nucleotide pyrophosphohydrolase [Pelagicoccus sp. SDUM812002]|uniref:nucleotide pyrophosphohydrolase n=1 Tax=Pelagicoccus sp. SDUM812002 TaxID=3041266 RepID=UPI00280CCCD2|nr:nucleotide pyrophosphohydrolase [Pelagicoccus sp. SDUM812002]MDQ8188002.1 nucleotide pyrophosphohydrolase [Pelagicoccus sp. SDUM812002]
MSNTDEDTPIAALKTRVAEFARDREWEQFHTLKNLSVALAVEAAELMEPFQWLEGEQCDELLRDPAKREAVEDELADVVIYALQIANRGGVDLAVAIDRKMKKNARRYPVDLAKGNSDKRS